eukprot:356308-Chlamydomonas_euryale.AAC.4
MATVDTNVAAMCLPRTCFWTRSSASRTRSTALRMSRVPAAAITPRRLSTWKARSACRTTSTCIGDRLEGTAHHGPAASEDCLPLHVW